MQRISDLQTLIIILLQFSSDPSKTALDEYLGETL
jgi:hypothetical protein